MNRTLLTLAGTCLLTGSALAQEVRVRVVPSESDVLEYTISSKVEVKTARKLTIDGEERGGRGGGAGPIKSAQNVVFQDGPSHAWRHYKTAAGTVTRSRNGEDQTTKIQGALHGKRLVSVEEEGKSVVKEGTAKGKAVPKRVLGGIPMKLNLRGLASSKPVEVGSTFELKKNFASALRGLLQPVRAANAGGGNRAAGGARRGQGRGQGGERGERGQRGQGRRAGGRQGGGNRPTYQETLTRMLLSKKIAVKGTGKLVSVKDVDGRDLATIAIEGTIKAAGTPKELGLTGTRRGGRRNRSGGGGGDAAAAPAGEASFEITVKGTVVVDQTDNRLQKTDLTGSIATNMKTSRTMKRNEVERKIDAVSTTTGTFQVSATCVNKGAPKQAEPAKTGGK